MVSSWSDEEKNIGCMPESWIKNLKKDEIGTKTKEVQKLFAEFARSISVLTSKEYMQDAEKMIDELKDRLFRSGVSDEKINETIDKLRKYLKEDVLEKCNDAGDKLISDLDKIIQKECSIEFLNNGMYGFAFKIKTDDEEFILKTYRPDALSILGRHGKTTDTANAAHLSSSMKPTQCARFYMGKIIEGKNPEGYSLSGFVKPNPDKQAAKDREMWFRDNKLTSSKYVFTDLAEIDSEIMDDNLIDGKLIDFGGVCYRYKNKNQQMIAKELYPLINKGDKEGIKALREKYAGSKDFDECVERLNLLYGFGSQLNCPSKFAKHALFKKLNAKEIAGFEALGIDYSKIREGDWSKLSVEQKNKLEELFN